MAAATLCRLMTSPWVQPARLWARRPRPPRGSRRAPRRAGRWGRNSGLSANCARGPVEIRTSEQRAPTIGQDGSGPLGFNCAPTYSLPFSPHGAPLMNANALIDLDALKARQQTAWASGDYAVIGTTLQLVGELLAESCDLRWDERVLDVAAGNGNATLAAARRGCRVTSTDYVPELLERGAERARAERLPVEFKVADAEALPFEEASFDAVLSTFGVMFSPDQARA